jgi:hypothetical protein
MIIYIYLLASLFGAGAEPSAGFVNGFGPSGAGLVVVAGGAPFVAIDFLDAIEYFYLGLIYVCTKAVDAGVLFFIAVQKAVAIVDFASGAVASGGTIPD